MEIRILSGEEMAKIPQPDGIGWPAAMDALAAFEDGELVGRVGIVSLAHLEGTWIAPPKRSGFLLFRLYQKVESVLKARGLTHVFAFTADPAHTAYLERVGYVRQPFEILVKEL